ncbi:hypothetical protein [Tsukamurella soli]|uniref:Lipoprotein n=1 Tax=Tsukamurella soli TaxID=644556 RepID=A0ABP8JT71_9ACTN
MTGAICFGALFALGCLVVAAMLDDAGQTRTAHAFSRYDVFDRYADLGCGADEYDRTRRFTRPTERTAPAHPCQDNRAEADDPTTSKRTES